MSIFGFSFPMELVLFYGAVLILILLIISISGLVIAVKANKRMKKVLQEAA